MIEDCETFALVYDYIKSKDVTQGKHFWLGATDEVEEGTWKFVNNRAVPQGVPFWGKGEPNSGNTHNCAIMHASYNHYWYDIQCENKYRKSLAVLACVVAVAVATPSLRQQWQNFKAEHGRRYASVQEERYRLSVFEQNQQFIDDHNARFENGEVTFTLQMNQFGDMTSEEFTATMNGFLNVPSRRPTAILRADPDETLPKEVDWRTKGAVTPVKDQKQCGSCWAFSTTGSLEGQHFLKDGKLVSLSEQNLVDCSDKFGNMGCMGGLMDQAFRYIKANKGIDTEDSYPYEAQDGKCRFDASNVGATDTGYVDVEHGSESALKKAVATIGPISVAIDASQPSFQFYHDGVYYEEGCSSTMLDHGVLAVGYGETEKGEAYWLVKNSWNTSWGNNQTMTFGAKSKGRRSTGARPSSSKKDLRLDQVPARNSSTTTVSQNSVGYLLQHEDHHEEHQEWLWPVDSTQQTFIEAHRVGARHTGPFTTLNSAKPLRIEHVTEALLHMQRKVHIYQVCAKERDGNLWWQKRENDSIDFKVLERGMAYEDILNDIWSDGLLVDSSRPTWRARLVPAAEDAPCPMPELKAAYPYQYNFMTVTHHAVGDGVSVAFLCQLFVNLLNAVIDGQAIDDKPFGMFVSNEDIAQQDRAIQEQLRNDQ
ncbi:hypothetical protein MQC27_24985 [Escherichia coli]|nr:hypothetical protein [Escherichia coli]